MTRTNDINVTGFFPLIPPKDLLADLPQTPAANQTVVAARQVIRDIIAGHDPRMLLIVGPCSIHDPRAALEYARRLVALREELRERLFIVMRVYFEKPRTTIGWKGLVYDPHLDGSADIEGGLRIARSLLLDINSMQLPAATEWLDPIVPQYLADLVSWAAIGARTAESQVHRQLASGLSMPVGFKNRTDGNIQVALDALASSRHPHSFLGIDQDGRSCIVKTAGNAWGHIVLRGSGNGPNYDAGCVRSTADRLRLAGLPAAVLIDCSHGNTDKRYEMQAEVFRQCVSDRAVGSAIIGAMLESNLYEGSQSLGETGNGLRYGVSITDACIGWEQTEQLLRWAAAHPPAEKKP